MYYVKISEARTRRNWSRPPRNSTPTRSGSFELMTPRALAGSLEACQAFVRSLRLFVDEVSEATDPHGALKEAGYHETLLLRGLSAQLTGWVGSFGFGRVSWRLLPLLPESWCPLYADRFSLRAGPRGCRGRRGRVPASVLASLRLQDDPLVVIGRELQLNKAELGDLFRVSRQAVSEWMDKGVPRRAW